MTNHKLLACRKYIANHVEAQLFSQTIVLEISCPSHPCPEKLGYDTLTIGLLLSIYRWTTLLLNHRTFLPEIQHCSSSTTLVADPNFRWCLNVRCEPLLVSPRQTSIYVMCPWDHDIWKPLLIKTRCNLDTFPIVQCARCYKKSCFAHQRPWHESLICEEFDSLRPNVAADQDAARCLIDATTQQCTKCKKGLYFCIILSLSVVVVQNFYLQIERAFGCDHIIYELWIVFLLFIISWYAYSSNLGLFGHELYVSCQSQSSLTQLVFLKAVGDVVQPYPTTRSPDAGITVT